MRQAFCDGMMREQSRKDFVFLTGDLGFRALEPLRDAMGPRFINAGVAEQNMVSVAAGLARLGLRPWVYSIAPFVFARPFEQIRNDICLHNLSVVLVGNGGGYGYGPLEDSSRLIPNLVRHGLQKKLPEFVRPDISRDFVYVDDVSAAFIQTALHVKETEYGDSFNIGTGRKVTMADIAGLAQNIFEVPDAPQFTMTNRQWDVADWYAQPAKAERHVPETEC